MPYQYPLKLSFKLISMGPQIFVKEASGREVLFVHQKAFKLKEDVAVYVDSSKNRELYRIKADRIMDFSARYHFTDSTSGMDMGSIKREGMRSIFKASYNIFGDGDQITHHIKEDNAWVRVMDAVFADLPIIGMFSGYVFNPTYTVYQSGVEKPILHIKKLPAFFEGAFELTRVGEPASETEETRLILAVMMMTLLERSRG
jgi:hypothetical protein